LESGERATTAAILTARDCHRLGVVDVVVAEPAPAAHADLDAAAHALGSALIRALADLAGVGQRRLLEERTRRVRGLGQATPEGQEAVRREMRELQEVQRGLARSVAELRERWDARQRGRTRLQFPSLPTLPTMPTLPNLPSFQRPDLTELAARFGARPKGLTGSGQGTPDAERDEKEDV
jgi:hypothetical protein